MAQDPTKKKIVHAHLPAEENFTTTLTAGNHELLADESTSVDGGKDKGPDPYDYLLMSLGCCTLMTVKMYANRKGWTLGDAYMELRHNKRHDEDCENCDNPNSKIDVIEKELILDNDKLTDEQMDKLLDISQKCPVHRTLLGEIKIESSISKK